MFFETLGIKWWYEPEGFALRFDYEEYASCWRDAFNMTEDELLQEKVPQTFQHLDGKEYTYLPDFYLPELNVWVEIKGPNPTRAEIEKAFLLNHMVSKADWAKLQEAKTDAESRSAFDDLLKRGVWIIYGDIPWPFPQKGNILGYGTLDLGTSYLPRVPGESERKATEYRSLLLGRLKQCWQECPLCLKIGVGEIGLPYCRSCHDDVVEHTWAHVVECQVMREAAQRYGVKPKLDPVLNPVNVKAMELTKSLMNPEFFTSGHKSPKLQRAYNAARSARFEHGESP